MVHTLLFGQSNGVKIINITKIVLLVFISFSLLAYFYPFYTDKDSLVYGITTISLAKGSYSYTSDLLKETGLWEFVPVQWVKTIHNTAIPKTGVGIYGFSTISYFLGDYYGLFYIGPIFSILFLISAERIATNLFGRFVGLVTLIFLVSDFTITIIGRQLMTDNIFSLFFILGCFFLIKFLREKKNKLIIFSSIFFVITAFIRIPGLIFLPIEIFIVISYLAYETISNKKKNLNIKNLNHYNNLLHHKNNFFKFIKIGSYIAIPWTVFILFMLAFNAYYFGEPLTTYQDVNIPENIRGEPKSVTAFFQFDSKFFEYTKYYSTSLLPDIIRESLVNLSSTENLPPFEINWIGIFSLFIFIPTLIISFYDKTKRKEVIIFCLFMVGWILFYSSNYNAPTIENPPTSFLRDRYMIPILPLFYMLFGFIMDRIWRINTKRNLTHQPKLSGNSFKVITIFLVSVLLISSLYSSQAAADIMNKQLSIHNPISAAERYPLDKEGLSEKSVIVGSDSRKTLEYNLTSFFPYWELGRYEEVNPDTIPKEPIRTLKTIMEEGYETFMFKGGLTRVDLPYFKFLETDHGIILKNYSKTFCKLELTDNQNVTRESSTLSDDICYISMKTEVICVENRCFNIQIEWHNDREDSFIP